MIEYSKSYYIDIEIMQKRNFNLLKPLQPPRTTWDRIYEWLIGKARVVILVTELIVATTFIFKVIVDTTAKNKDREIERNEKELSFYGSELEPKFRRLQLKSDKYSQIWNGASEYTGAITEVFSYISSESSNISVNIVSGNLNILGSDDLDEVRNIESAMKSSKNFTNVTIDDLTLNQEEVKQNKGRYILSAKIVDIKRDQI